jgi:WD40 repeat protein
MNQWAGLYLCLAKKALTGGWEGATLAGHRDAVTTAAVSGNGRYVLSGSADKTLRLWEVANGPCLRTFEGHAGVVTAVALGPSGRYAASGATDETLRLWDAATAQCLGTFAGHKGVVTAVALTGDDRYLVSASADGTLKLWEAGTGRCLRTFAGHTDPVHAAALSADGRFILSGAAQFLIRNDTERLFTSGQLRLWETATGRSLPTFEGLADAVTSVYLSPDGRHAVSGGGRSVLDPTTGKFTQSGQAALWDVPTGRCLANFAAHTGAVTAVALTTDSRFVLSGSTDTTLKLWDGATGACLRTFQGHTDAITAAGLSPDGRYALSGSADRTLKVWVLDWDLADNPPADWDEGALPYLEMFLARHTPYAGQLPGERRRPSKDSGTLPAYQPTRPAVDDELALALTRRGKATWTGEDLEELLYTLGCAGYGWLRPEGVERHLETLAASWNGPEPPGSPC